MQILLAILAIISVVVVSILLFTMVSGLLLQLAMRIMSIEIPSRQRIFPAAATSNALVVVYILILLAASVDKQHRFAAVGTLTLEHRLDAIVILHSVVFRRFFRSGKSESPFSLNDAALLSLVYLAMALGLLASTYLYTTFCLPETPLE